MSGDSTTMRDDAWMVPGQVEAQRRLRTHEQMVRPAFESLDVMSVSAATDYLEQPLRFLTRQLGIHLSGADPERTDPVARAADSERRGQLLGVVLGFAMVCVEADRRQRE